MNELNMTLEDGKNLAAAIVKDINAMPYGSQRSYVDAKVGRYGNGEREEAVKYLSRITNPTGVAGSVEYAKQMLTVKSNEISNIMNILMLIIDDPHANALTIEKAKSQLDSLTEFSLVMMNALAAI